MAATAPREASVLRNELQQFSAKLQSLDPNQYPSVGSDDFVSAPSWAELQPLRNKATALQSRVEHLLAIEQVTRSIMKLYLARDMAVFKHAPAQAKDSSEGLHYTMSQLNQYAILAPTLIHEFLPTIDVDDPSYQTRIDGLQKVRIGLFGMLQGTLITLQAQRADLSDRQQLAATLHQRGELFQSILEPDQQKQIGQWLDQVLAKETDPRIRVELKAAASAIVSSSAVPL